MVLGYGIRVKNPNFEREGNSIKLPVGKIFLIIDSEETNMMNSGVVTYIGLQTTTNLKQKKYDKNQLIIDTKSNREYVVKLNQLYKCPLDLDIIKHNPNISIQKDLQISDELMNFIKYQLNVYEPSDFEIYDAVEDFLEVIKPKNKEIYDLPLIEDDELEK